MSFSEPTSIPATLQGRKLGLLVSAAPGAPGFGHALGMAEAAMRRSATVYLYCIDEAVRGVDDPRLQALRCRGLILYACAYGAQQRGLALSDRATFAGLTIVNDLVAGTDRFLSFN